MLHYLTDEQRLSNAIRTARRDLNKKHGRQEKSIKDWSCDHFASNSKEIIMTAMRAKMQVQSILQAGVIKDGKVGQETVVMGVVCSKAFGPNGESEDNTFARYTPAGGLNITITNPDLIGTFKLGQKFYLDFTE